MHTNGTGGRIKTLSCVHLCTARRECIRTIKLMQ